MRRDEEEVVWVVIDHLGYVPNVGGSVLIDADEESSFSKSIVFGKHLPLKMLPVELPENPYPIAIMKIADVAGSVADVSSRMAKKTEIFARSARCRITP